MINAVSRVDTVQDLFSRNTYPDVRVLASIGNHSPELLMNRGKFQNKYRSATARAVCHDYNNGDYFITICTKNRRHFFGRIVDQEMVFSETGKYAVENLAGDSEQ